MVGKRPFLEDGSQFGVSRTQFRKMRKAEKRDLILQWFYANYEDPAENTPFESAEGGYQYIWGGPYEARDELYAMFGDIVPESLIEDVANEIEKGGTFDWAPVQKEDDYEQNDDEPASLEIYLDEPSERYGSAAELGVRAQALVAIERLEKIIEKRRAIGIGHNLPPEPVEEGPDEPELREAVHELKLEFKARSPAIATIKKWANRLRDVLVVAGKWVGKKLDKVVDSAMTVIGTGGGGYVLSQYVPPIRHAFETIINWLDIAAKTLF